MDKSKVPHFLLAHPVLFALMDMFTWWHGVVLTHSMFLSKISASPIHYNHPPEPTSKQQQQQQRHRILQICSATRFKTFW